MKNYFADFFTYWNKPQPKVKVKVRKIEPKVEMCLWCHSVRDSKNCKCKEAAEYQEALQKAHQAEKYGFQAPDLEDKQALIAWSKIDI